MNVTPTQTRRNRRNDMRYLYSVYRGSRFALCILADIESIRITGQKDS